MGEALTGKLVDEALQMGISCWWWGTGTSFVGYRPIIAIFCCWACLRKMDEMARPAAGPFTP